MMSENLHLAVKIAQLYYDSGLTQDDIAQKLRLSRPKVSRLLQEARDAGLVKITVAEMPGLHTELENRLEQKYGLLDVLAVDVSAAGSTKNLAGEPGAEAEDTYENTARELGAAAAAYLRRTVQDGDTIGLTWGLTLSAMVDNLTPEKKKQITITQLVGGMGEPAAETHATDLVRRMAMSFGRQSAVDPRAGDRQEHRAGQNAAQRAVRSPGAGANQPGQPGLCWYRRIGAQFAFDAR